MVAGSCQQSTGWLGPQGRHFWPQTLSLLRVVKRSCSIPSSPASALTSLPVCFLITLCPRSLSSSYPSSFWQNLYFSKAFALSVSHNCSILHMSRYPQGCPLNFFQVHVKCSRWEEPTLCPWSETAPQGLWSSKLLGTYSRLLVHLLCLPHLVRL